MGVRTRLRGKRGALSDEHGFTLAELMTVVFIMSILSLIATLIYTRSISASRRTTCKSNLRIIDSAISQYEARLESTPADIDVLVTAGFLRKVPVDPHTGQTDYSIVAGRAYSEGGHQDYP